MEYDFIRDSVYIGGSFTQSTLHSGYIDENTYINPHSYEVATYAAGSSIAAAERTLAGESCVALVRPRATMRPRHGQWGSASSTTWRSLLQRP